jgi:hypothetical protein
MNLFDIAKGIVSAEAFIKFLLPYAGIPPKDADAMMKIIKEGIEIGENPERIWMNVNKANAELAAGESLL